MPMPSPRPAPRSCSIRGSRTTSTPRWRRCAPPATPPTATPSTSPTRRRSRRRVARIEAELGPIDILFNNAGIQRRTPLEDFPVETWREVMAINLDAVFYVGQAVAQADDPARPRQDHQHLLARQRDRPRHHLPLRHLQGRGEDADQGDVRGMGEVRHPGQRHRPRLHQDRDQPGAGRQNPEFNAMSSAARRPAAGARSTN